MGLAVTSHLLVVAVESHSHPVDDVLLVDPAATECAGEHGENETRSAERALGIHDAYIDAVVVEPLAPRRREAGRVVAPVAGEDEPHLASLAIDLDIERLGGVQHLDQSHSQRDPLAEPPLALLTSTHEVGIDADREGVEEQQALAVG